MTEVEKKATREGFGDALAELAVTNENVVVLDADLNDSTKSDFFREKAPDRFINAGIAEQNLVGIAAGLAASGKIAFASSFAIFTERAFEFMRNIVSRNSINVKLTGSHGGIHTGEDGKSAQALEDLGIYRTLPNVVVLQPCDYVEARKAVHALAARDGPSYMRVLRNKLPIIHSEDYEFEIGKGEVLRNGKDVAIFATGVLVHEALEAAEILDGEGVAAYVVNMHTIKPIDKELVVKLAKETGCVVTAEDHNIIGGLGSAVCEVLSEESPCRVLRIGVEDKFGESGKPAELYEKYGLNAKHIAEKVKKAVKEK
jgi:transketolase